MFCGLRLTLRKWSDHLLALSFFLFRNPAARAGKKFSLGVGKNSKGFEYYFLSAINGLSFFRIFLGFYLAAGRTKNDDFKLYLLGWLFFPALGFLFGNFIADLRDRWRPQNPYFYPVLIFLNFTFALFALHPAQWGLSGWALTGCFLLLQILALAAIPILERSFPNSRGKWHEIPYLLMFFSFGLWFFKIQGFLLQDLNHWTPARGLALAGIVAALYASGSSRRKDLAGDSPNLFFHALAFIFIVAMVVEPGFTYDPYHYASYLGPLSDMCAGKTLLTNVNTQYGILVYYFLRFFFLFLPLGYTSLCLLLTAAYILQYFSFYFIARKLFGSEFLSFFALAALVLVNYFAPEGQATWYPSIGPLRFGFIYLLMALVVLRNRHPRYRSLFLKLEEFAAAAAFLWSFEVCLFTLPAYLGLAAYESLEVRHGRLRFEARDFWKRVSGSLVFAALFLAFFYLDVIRRTGKLPQWSLYFDYNALHLGGFFLRWMPASGCWWAVVVVLYFSFFAVLGVAFRVSNRVDRFPNFNAIALLTFYGITQFYYYVGRAVGFNLLAVSMPSLLLFLYWLYFLRRHDLPSAPWILKKGTFVLGVLAIGIYLPLFVPRALQKIQYKKASLPDLWDNIAHRPWDEGRQNSFAQTAESLMSKYSGAKKELVYFFGDYKGLEVSMYCGRAKVYPYNNVFEADICPAIRARLLAFDPKLKPGDCIYLSKDFSQTDVYYEYPDSSQHLLSNLEPTLLSCLASKYQFNQVEEKDGIAVFRVTGAR